MFLVYSCHLLIYNDCALVVEFHLGYTKAYSYNVKGNIGESDITSDAIKKTVNTVLVCLLSFLLPQTYLL